MSVAVVPGQAVAIDNAFAGSNSFANMNGGSTFPANCTVVVAISGNDITDGTTVTSPQIGGQALTRFAGVTKCHIYYVDLASSGIGDTLTFGPSNAFGRLGLACWYLTGAATGGPSHSAVETFGGLSGSQTLDAPVTVDANGAGVIAVYGNSIPAGITDVTWTGATAGPAFAVASTLAVSAGAYTNTAGSWNPSVVGVGQGFAFNAGMIAGTWAASGGPSNTISGVTKDNVGAPLGSCDVFLFKYNSGSTTLSQVAYTVSNATTGVYSFSGLADTDPAYIVVSYKSTGPTVFDVTDHNLQPVAV